MAESDQRPGIVAVAQNILEPPSATGTTSAAAAAASSHDDGCGGGGEGFTFATVPRVADGRIGPVYPVFGRPRSPPLQEEDDPGTATVRVPLGQLLLEDRGSPASGQQPDHGELDGVPAETYCLWSPGSPAPYRSSPARCGKSGSTGSVLRWRQRRRVGRSHSDGKDKFVFLQTSSERNAGGGHGWIHHGRGGASKGGGGGGDDGRKSAFLPYKHDLVGLFANADAFRRSYLPF